ncbi:hypothetical protein ACEPAG_6731 [Sanghuangporus baumii]
MLCGNRIIRIPRNGIYKLPDELLLIIAQYYVSRYGDMVILASVCPRFKSIVFSPAVWSKCWLTVDCGVGIEDIVRESRGALLRASIVFRIQDIFREGRVGERPSSASHVLRHSLLFKEVHIDLYHQLSSYFWRKVFSDHPMPRLLRLETSFIPRPMPFNMVTQCVLKLIAGYETQSELLDFLASVPALHSFKITIMEMEVKEVKNRSNKTVVLRNLREMELGVDEKHISNAAGLLGNLVLDMLASLSISIFREDHSAPEIDEIARAVPNFRSLQTLQLEKGHPPKDTQRPDVFPSNIISPSSNSKTDALGSRTQARRVVWRYHRGGRGSSDSLDVSIIDSNRLSSDTVVKIIISSLHLCDKARIHFF